MERYSEAIEARMQQLYDSLSEKDSRRYASVEAAKLGHGGIEYVAELFGCDPKTISSGLRVVVEYAKKVYHVGVKASQFFLDNDPTRRDAGKNLSSNSVVQCTTHRYWCAVESCASSAGVIPARQLSFQPVAIGAATEVTKSSKPLM